MVTKVIPRPDYLVNGIAEFSFFLKQVQSYLLSLAMNIGFCGMLGRKMFPANETSTKVYVPLRDDGCEQFSACSLVCCSMEWDREDPGETEKTQLLKDLA